MALVPAHQQHFEKDVALTHDSLLTRGILSKTMINSYQRCPVAFEMRYIKGSKSPPGFAMSVGILGHEMMERANNHVLDWRLPLPVADMQDLLAGRFNEVIQDVPNKEVEPKDPILTQLTALYMNYQEQKFFQLHEPKAIEWAIGHDDEEPIELGGQRISAHIDLVDSSNRVLDYKFIGYSSPYRRMDPRLALELVIAAKLTKSKKVGYFLMIKNKKVPEVERKIATLADKHVNAVSESVYRVGTAIKKGNFPSTHTPGMYPCTPRACGYYGKCPVTKSLS